MEITKLILLIAYIVFASYILYRLFLRKDPYQAEYERMYNEIINSDKYKVKSQWNKEH